MNHTDGHPKRKTQADARAERLGAALKSNLRRRKAQARERAGLDREDGATSDRTETRPVAGGNEE